jgi:thioredoxin-like negative regulator of GroEL
MESKTVPGADEGPTRRVNPDDIARETAGAKKTVVLFEMTTCPYCRMFDERFEDFARRNSGGYDFLRVVLDNPDNPLWRKFDLRAVPTVIVFAEGRIDARLDSVLFLGITKKNWAEFTAGLQP